MAVASVKFRCRLQGLASPAVAANDSGSVAGLRDAALLAVASDGLLRVSEIAALDVGDVQAEADGSGRLLVGESKTDQEGQGAVLYLGALTVQRVNAAEAPSRHRPAAGPQVVYNLIGPNARVNIQSSDSSTNVVSVESAVLFDNLREAIQKSSLDSTARPGS